MRTLATADRIRELMRRLGEAADGDTRIYVTGGATAVLIGWRDSTVDVDVKLVPERDSLFRAIPRLKEELNLNVELACPSDFIPAPAGWESRCLFISREGKVDWHHFDPVSQALSKIERGHARDAVDVEEMLRRGLVTTAQLIQHFLQIRPELIRYPAIDPDAFEQRVESWSAGR